MRGEWGQKEHAGGGADDPREFADRSELESPGELTVFEPRMDASRREELYAGWKRAVERSRGWLE